MCAMKAAGRLIAFVLLVVNFSLEVHGQAARAAQSQPEFVRQARELLRQGKRDAALALYQQELKSSPDSGPANIGAGSVLDLLGRGEEARKYFARALEAAETPEARASAARAMAMSYAFEANCGKTVEYEKLGFDIYGARKDFYRQGEIADEAARVCLDSGDLDTAYQWYKTGHDTGLMEPNITPARRDLWEFRWEHAQARIAARRNQPAEAQQHVAAAKAILDRGTNPEQAQYFP